MKNTTNRILRIFISTLLVFTHVTGAADHGFTPGSDDPSASHPPGGEGVDQPTNPFTLPHTFRLIVPTVDQSHVPGNLGSLMLNFESTPVDQMGEMLERARAQGLLADWAKHPPEIFVYVPKDVFEHNGEDLTKQAIVAFREAYPGVEPKVTLRVDQTDLTYTALYKKLKRNLADERAKNPDATLRAALDEQDEILDVTLQETKQRMNFTAGQSRRYKGYIAKFRAGLVFFTRLGTVGSAVFGGLGPATIALTMSAADAGIELFTATWSQRMQKALSKNPFELKERIFFAGKKYQVSSNAINATVSVAINTMWNMLFFVVIRATVLQSLQHAALPLTYAWPLAPALLSTVIYNLGPAAMNAYFVKGYLTMVNKGWISSAKIDMALQLMAVPDTTNNFANSMPEKIGWVRKYTMTLLLATFGTVGYFGGKLPRKTNRIVLIHDAVNLANETNDPKMEQANIAATLNIGNDDRDLRFGEQLEKIRQLRAIRAGGKECSSHLDGTDPVPPPLGDAA